MAPSLPTLVVEVDAGYTIWLSRLVIDTLATELVKDPDENADDSIRNFSPYARYLMIGWS